MIQNWNDDSGVIRYKLGVALNDLTYSLSDNNEEILMTYNSTEFANRQFTISDREGTVYTSDATTGPSGENQMTWNRINSKNEQVAPGNYTINIELQSLYDESIITRESSFYLPLFYHVNCGDEDNTPAIKKISGTPASYNGRSVVESTDRIIYKISGLNPSSEYKVAAEFLKLDNESVQQQIFVDGLMLDQPFEINTADYKTDFIKLPVEALSDGMIQIEVQRVGSGNANLADLWIMETGKEFSILNAQKSLPTAYQLSQNYPNPFNPATTINYQLPGNSRVTLKVYDITGREIKTLVNNYQDAGEHQVIFDGNSLASGIYIYNLSWVAENGSKGFQSRKMVLIK